MSEETPVPILSYKKRPKGTAASLQDVSSGPGSPRISSPVISAPGTPIPGSRKVSSRRKALQEFYKLQEAENQKSSQQESNDIPTSNKTESDSGPIGLGIETGQTESLEPHEEIDVEKLADPAEMEKYIQSAPIEEMLRLRNRAAGKLNYHDVEKKSIIYDNYYELIKLSLVLSNLNAETTRHTKVPEESKLKVTDKYVNDVLGELTDFLAGDGALFNQDFALVVESVRSTMDDADSIASVQGIVGE